MRYLSRSFLFSTLAFSLSTGSVLAQSTASQNGSIRANLLGVDHVGINVPDLPQAVRFFTDVLGFTPVTAMGPIPLDSNWKSTFHMHPGTGSVSIKMTRAGYGANIELFYYEKNEGSQQLPATDDLGATHIAFYTPDINGSMAFLKSKGVSFLSDPITMTSGDTQGETWVYFLTPWGSKMELVSYPSGKAYEKHHPAVLLWSPKDVDAMPTIADTLSKSQLRQLAAAHLQIWNDKNAETRLQELDKVYAAGILFSDPSYVSTGILGLNKFIDDLQHQHPTFRFTLSRIDANHDKVRLYWNYGDNAHPALVKGMDLITVKNGQISSLYAYLDAAAK